MPETPLYLTQTKNSPVENSNGEHNSANGRAVAGNRLVPFDLLCSPNFGDTLQKVI